MDGTRGVEKATREVYFRYDDRGAEAPERSEPLFLEDGLGEVL